MRTQWKRLDQIIAPRGADDRVRIFSGPADFRAPQNPRGRFAGAGDHPERARQFAIPRNKRMQAASPVTKLVTVISSPNHMNEPARRPAIRVVINGKKISRIVESHREWIPEAGRESFKL